MRDEAAASSMMAVSDNNNAVGVEGRGGVTHDPLLEQAMRGEMGGAALSKVQRPLGTVSKTRLRGQYTATGGDQRGGEH